MNKEHQVTFFYYLFGFKKINKSLRLLWVICAHILGWLIIFSLPLFFYRLRITDPHFWYKELLNKIFLIAFFYFNYFYLIPRHFIAKKKILFLLLIFFCFCFLFAQELLVEKAFISTQPDELDPFQSRNIALASTYGFSHRHTIASIPVPAFFMVLTQTIYSFVFLLLFSGLIYITYYFLKGQDEKKTLENASLKAENNLLKSQINPHFLFNTLNSIYAQAQLGSSRTPDSILKLSGILRYMIYDTSAEKIDLAKDIQYLSSYIDLQRVRLSDKVTLNYSVEGKLEGLTIAPLLLITFIENAFKHGISYTNSSTINIHIEVFGKILTFNVSNPILTTSKFENGGIGLKNAKRRLELLYPGNHSLTISSAGHIYSVHLNIVLS